MKNIVCDCCGVTADQESAGEWSTGTFCIRRGYTKLVSTRADLCKKCTETFEKKRTDWWSILEKVTRLRQKEK